MAGVSRRRFLGASVGAAAGAAASAAALGPLAVAPALSALGAEPAEGTVVAFIRPGSTGEVSLMVGEQEIVKDDPVLVNRILKAAR